jgi:hypothetical protein
MLRMFIDSYQAGDKVSQCSRTGFGIFLNYGMIDWLSKKQSTVETSVIVAEFCAMKHGLENQCGIRYKLHMMGVTIKGPHMCMVITCLLSPMRANLIGHSGRNQT